MKLTLGTILILSFSFNVYAQSDTEKEKLLKPFITSTCNCIDSVDTFNKKKDAVIAEINKCIDKQALAYQTAAAIIDVAKKVKLKDQNHDIVIATSPDSKIYKKYYQELETALMEKCSPLKIKIATNDIVEENSWSKNPKAVEFYEKGVDEFKKFNYEKAIKLFESALKIDPKFIFALDNLGYSYRKLNNYDKALEAYEISLELNPNGIMPLQNIAVIYQFRKEFDKAINAFKKLEELDSKNPEPYYGLAVIYGDELKDYEKSLSNMSIAYKMYTEQKSPYRSDAEKFIGKLYQEFKKQDKLDLFKKILKENGVNFE